jgi:hypothetical protein
MAYIFEKNIVDIKHEYDENLTEILVPLLHEGLMSILARAQEHYDKCEELASANSDIKNPGIVKIFQICLKGVPTLSAAAVESEVRRIKEQSHCAEWFDDLVKAVVKSHIVLLTYNASGGTCELVREKFHDKININEFIHNCYIECAHSFYNNPELIIRLPEKQSHSKSSFAYRTGIQKDLTYKYIKKAIRKAINKLLPYKSMLKEYLRNDEIVVRNITQRKLDHYVHPPRDRDDIPHIDGENPQNGFSIVKSNAANEPILVDDGNLSEEKKSEGEKLDEDRESIKKDMDAVIRDSSKGESVLVEQKQTGVVLTSPGEPIVDLDKVSDGNAQQLPGVMIHNMRPDGTIIKPDQMDIPKHTENINVGTVKAVESNPLANINEHEMNKFFNSLGNM